MVLNSTRGTTAKKSLATLMSLLITSITLAPILVVIIKYEGYNFLLYLTFWVLIPGGFCLHFFKPVALPKLIRFVTMFLVGSGLLFLEFFLFYALNIVDLIKYVNPILSVFFVAYLIIKLIKGTVKLPKIDGLPHLLSQNIPFLLVMAVAVWLCAFNLIFEMPYPESMSMQDFTWHTGTVSQLASNFPFDDIRVTGVAFKYHFFSTLFLAIAKIIFDTDAWIYITQYIILFVPQLFTVVLYCLYSEFIKNKWIVAAVTLFSFTGFSLNLSFNQFLLHWSTNVNAAGFGLVYICTLFFFVKPIISKGASLNKRIAYNLLYALIIFFCCIGIKSPFAIVFLTAFICFFFLQWFKTKQFNLPFALLVVGFCIMFASMYQLLLSSGAEGYFSISLSDSLLMSTTRGTGLSAAYQALGESFISRSLLFIPSLFGQFTIMVIPLTICLVNLLLYIFARKKLSDNIVFATLIFLVGTTAYYTFFVNGMGQGYFLICALPFAGYISSDVFSKYCKHSFFKHGIPIICVCLTLLHFASSALDGYDIFPLDKCYNYFTGTNQQITNQTKDEFETFEFLKDHIKDDRLILSTTMLSEQKGSLYFSVPAFTEKKCYFEGYEYARRNLGFSDAEARQAYVIDLFSENIATEEKYHRMKNENIGYLLVFSDSIPTAQVAEGQYFTMIFSNDSTKVYELL